MLNDAMARELVAFLREEDEASAFNLAERIIASDRDLAVLTMLQLAALAARHEPGRP